MKWAEELRATRRSLAEVGLLFIVREVFKNQLSISAAEAEETLGTGWRVTAEQLRKAGLLRIISDKAQRRFKMNVIAPGDKKREKSRKITGLKRAMVKFESGITTNP